MSSTTGQPRNRRYIYTWYHSRESRSCAGKNIVHQNEYKRRSSSSAGTYVYKRGSFPQTRVRMYTSEADFHMRASMGYRVRRVLSRAVSSWSRSPGGCGFRCVFDWGGYFFVFSSSYFFERTRPAASMRPPLASFTSLLVLGCVQLSLIHI